MFYIYGERDYFFQWDTEQRIVVEDAAVNELHFCNKTDDCSLVCKVYDYDGIRVADVPNILLQDDFKINVYAYCGNYTKVSDYFKVISRSKPADYVYTETEVKRYETLEAEIAELIAALENYSTTEETVELINAALVGVENGAY